MGVFFGGILFIIKVLPIKFSGAKTLNFQKETGWF